MNWGAVLLVWLASAGVAWARPGGGETFSGPSGGGGGGGGGGDAIVFELVWFLLRLLFYYPKLMIPVLLVVVFLYWRSNKGKLESWSTPLHEHVVALDNRPRTATVDLAQLQALDPDFSRVLFEDFAYRLFASVQQARPSSEGLAALAPYLADPVRSELLRADWQSVAQVVVGALRVTSCIVPRGAEGQVHVELGFEANMTARSAHGETTLYVRESWQLSRSATLRSKPPGSYERLGCPNCGAAFRSSDNRRCEYCNQVVSDGRFDWQVVGWSVLEEQARPPALGGHVEERGTDLPTVVAPDFAARWTALCSKDAQLNEPLLDQRLALIYGELNTAWSGGDLSRVRALTSDGMFDYLSYWVEAYRKQNLRNVLENMHITRSQLVKVVSDRWFDAVTVRLFASGLDYTVALDGNRLVSGSRGSERAYSEYWTLIRNSGTRGAPRSDASCPNCAAPLKASMAGKCAYCSAHLTSGEFDWVLSKIEQDDVYDG
jgi:Tim44-like domain